ncbi:MAG TPA: peroxiredoxin [Acidimicrobiales bacterium]|nr:peroxiredoxin [Acidimicrobiales bacterium]
MPVDIGQEAPDFELRASTGDTVKLSQYRGDKAVALVFYPFTFTGVCQGELCALRDDMSRYENAGVQVLAVSCDTAPAQKKWAEEQGYNFPVLADFWPHGKVAQDYGVFNDKLGCAMRHTFLIDKDGTVVDHFDTDAIGTPREQARYEEALAKLV